MFKWIFHKLAKEKSTGKKPMQFEKRVVPGSGLYSTASGCFGFEYPECLTPYGLTPTEEIKKKIYWHGCRETFHNHIDPYRLRSFWFSHLNSPELLFKFLQNVEDKLNLAVRSSIQISDSNPINNTFIILSPWYVEDLMRLNFATITLRVAMTVSDKDWWTLLKTGKYFIDTNHALERFMSGYTCYTGPKQMWYSAFCKDSENINKLIKPKHSEVEVKDMISKISFSLWKESGSPDGKSEEFWNKAIKVYYGRLFNTIT